MNENNCSKKKSSNIPERMIHFQKSCILRSMGNAYPSKLKNFSSLMSDVRETKSDK